MAQQFVDFANQTSAEKNSRLDWVDYAKAIGIILVVYGHVARGIYHAGIEIPREFYEIVDRAIYSFHMPLFFFLSGIFFFDSLFKQEKGKFVSRKVDTIVYPYLVWSILEGIVEVVMSDFTNSTATYSEVFSLLWLPRQHFWFLYALFTTLILARVIFSVVPQKAVTAVFILSVVINLFPTILPDTLVFQYVTQYFVFLVFGIVFSFHSNTKYLSRALPLFVLSCSFVFVQVGFYYNYPLDDLSSRMMSLSIALVSILFVIALSSWASVKPNKLILYIGSSSMTIYLLHILAGSGIRVIFQHFMGLNSFVVHLVAGVVFGIFAPMIFLVLTRRLNLTFLFYAPLSEFFLFLFKRIRTITNNHK